MSDASATTYLLSAPRSEVEFLRVDGIPTVVRKLTDLPMSEMPTVFDSTFTALFPLLNELGLTPTGPAFALHHRMPDETATFELGVPVDRALDGEVTTGEGVAFSPARLPTGDIAAVSHLGAYEGLGESWGIFLERITDGGARPQLPFWEVYVTEPGPDVNPTTLRTDLYTVVSGTGGSREGQDGPP